MKEERAYIDYLEDILDAAEKAQRFVAGITYDTFVNDDKTTFAYVLLREGGVYEDLGANYFDEQHERAVVTRMKRRLEQLGYEVALEKRAA